MDPGPIFENAAEILPLKVGTAIEDQDSVRMALSIKFNMMTSF